MRRLLLIFFCVCLAAGLAAESAVQIDPETVKAVAFRQAETLWDKVFADEPIPLKDQFGDVIAWQFNFSKGVAFPDKESLLARIRMDGNMLWGAAWNGAEFANLIVGARKDQPAVIGYSNGLSYEYSHSARIAELAESHLGPGYQIVSYRLNGLASRWAEISDGNTTLFIKAYPPAQVLSRDEYLAQLCSDAYPAKPAQDYSAEWEEFLEGRTQTRENVLIAEVEKMPFIAYSFGCSATSAAMIVGYYDNKSSSPTQNYATFSGVHYQRYDYVSEDVRYHVPSSLTELAVFLDTDSLTFGLTWPWDMPDGMHAFFASKGHSSWNCLNSWHWDYSMSNSDMMADFRNEIAWDSPTLMNTYNHTVVGVGYVSGTHTAILQDPNNYEHVFWNISDFWYLAKVHPRPKPGCTVNIIQPDGGQGWHEEGDGEVYQAGSVMDISWETDTVPGSYAKIYYTAYPNYGSTTWHPITLNAPNSGSFGWIIPNDLSGYKFRVKIQVFDSQNNLLGVDGSHGSFTINPGGSIPELVDNVSVGVVGSPRYYRLNAASTDWAVAGLRKTDGINYSTRLSLSSSDFATQHIGTQSSDAVNWIAMDRNHLGTSQYGLRAELTPFTSHNRLEFEGGSHSLSVGQNTGITWATDDVVKIWDLPLSADSYSFVLSFPGSSGDLGFALVSSQDGVYYKTSDQYLGMADYDNVPGFETFSAIIPASDTYGLVVWSNSNYSGTISITIGYNSIWTGAVNNNWNNSGNWSSGSLPNSSMDVLIPSGVPRNPSVVYGTTAVCRSLTTAPGSTLFLYGTLDISGTADLSGTLSVQNAAAQFNPLSIYWRNGSSLNEAAPCTFNVYRHWTVASGASVAMTSSTVNFIGVNASTIKVDSANRFFHLNINKSSNASAVTSEFCASPLKVYGNLTIGATAGLICDNGLDLELRGNLDSQGSLIFYGGTLNFNDNGSQSASFSFAHDIQSVTVSANSYLTLNSDLVVHGDMTINGGILRADNRHITVYGDWKNNAGTFTGSSSWVTFSGEEDASCFEPSFKKLELAKAQGAELIIQPDDTVTCDTYLWNSGSIRVMDGALFRADDLLNLNIVGRYYLDGGQIDLFQDGSQFVDLNADLYITDGEFRVHGGMAPSSTWALTRAVTVMMEGGVLDFMDCGILLSNTGYNLNDIISGGTIRTSGSFVCQRPGFNPAVNTLELYGEGEAEFACSSPSKPYDLVINKASREGDSRSRINQITVTANSAVSNTCTVQSGIFKINDNVEFKTGGYLEVHGTLQMNGSNSVVDVYGTPAFMDGSTANLTAGTLKAHNSLIFQNGSNVNIPAAFKIVCLNAPGLYLNIYTSQTSVLGTLVWENTSGNLIIVDYPLVLSGDLIIKSNGAITVTRQITVAGKIDIWPGGTLNMASSYPVSTANLYNSGLLNLPSTCTGTLSVSGTFLQYASGQLALHGGSLIIDTAYGGTLYSFGGTSSMSGGTLQITNNGMQIGSSGFTFSGGTIKLGWSFAAIHAGSFVPNAGLIVFTGNRSSSINLGTGNRLPNLTVSMTGASGALNLFSDLTVAQSCLVQSGKLYVNHHVLTAGSVTITGGYLYANNSDDEIRSKGNWTNSGGEASFIEGSGLVRFTGTSTTSLIATSETFANLTLEIGARYLDLAEGMDLTVTGDLNIVSGNLRPLPGTDVIIHGNLNISGASSSLHQYLGTDDPDSGFRVYGDCNVNGGKIYSVDSRGNPPTEENLTVDGNLILNGGQLITMNVLIAIHGNFSTTVSTYLNTRASHIVNDAPYSGSWQDVNCQWITYGSVIEFTHKGLRLVSGALLDNNYYSVFRIGRGLNVSASGLLTDDIATLEFIGSDQSNITLAAGNSLPSVIVNKSSASVVLTQPVRINGDLTIQSGNFNSGGNTITLGGSWINNVGPSGYTCGTGELICDTTGSLESITGSQNFYKLTIAVSQENRGIYLDADNSTILTDLVVQDGWLTMRTDVELQVEGSVAIHEGASFHALAGVLKVRGNFADQNPLLSSSNGYNPSYMSTLCFNGPTTQALVFSRDQIDLGSFTLAKTGGAFQPAKPISIYGNLRVESGTLDYGLAGLSHTIGGGFYVGPSGYWADNTCEIVFTGSRSGTIEVLGTALLKNLRVAKTNGWNSLTPVTLLSNLTLGTTGSVVLDSGILDVGGYTFQTKGEIDVNVDAMLKVGPGGVLKITSGGSLEVNNEGTLQVVGSASSPATVTRVSTGNYQLQINGGGTLQAKYAVFEYMDTNGVSVTDAAVVDTYYGLDNCTFRYGQAGGTLLKLENSQTLEIWQASFPTSTGSFNVTKLNDQGTVSFQEETGAFIGSAYEMDPWSRINWSNEIPGIIALPASYDFGPVTWSQSSPPQYLLINNPGNGILIANLTTPEGFRIELARSEDGPNPETPPLALTDPSTRNTLTVRVWPYSSASCRIYFEPLAPIPYSGQILITHNAPTDDVLLSVTGTGVGPQLHLEPSYPYFNIVSGQSSSQTVWLSNTGTEQLTYNCWINYPFPVAETVVQADFENGFPPSGWTEQNVSGSTSDWDRVQTAYSPIYANPYEGSWMGWFNSATASIGASRRLYSGYFDLTGLSSPSLSFAMVHDTNSPTAQDRIQAQISVGGGSWTNLGSPVYRYDGSIGWYTYSFDLSAYDGQTDLRVGLLGISAHGQHIYVDEIKVTALRSLPPNWITVNGSTFASGSVNPSDPPYPLVMDVNTAGVPQGTYSAGLAFMSNDSGYPMTTAGIVINIGAPGCSVYPSSFSFLNAPVGYPASQTLEINNPGNIVLNGSFTVPECFRVEPPGGGDPVLSFSVQPGLTQLFNLVFEPLLPQGYTSSLLISYTGGSDIYVPLSGQGVDYPVVSTAPVTNIGYTTATGGGNVSGSGNLPILERGVCWYTTENPTLEHYHGSAAGSLGDFTVPMADLLPGYTYWVRAYATNSLGTSYGNQQSFELPSPALTPNPLPFPDFPTTALGTSSAPQILSVSGSALSGTVTVFSSNGFLISLADDENYSLMLELQPVDYVLPPTPIYIRFYPLERGPWAGDISFSASGLNPVMVNLNGIGAALPEVEAATVVDITSETATVNSRIVDDGSDPVSACGVCWNTSGSPTLADPYDDAGPQTCWYDCQLTGLSSFTTYYVRPFATNVAGTVYGNQLSFTTHPNSQITIDATLLNPFGSVAVGQISTVDTLSVSAQELLEDLVLTAPEGFELSLSLTGRTFAPQLSIAPVNGEVSPTLVYVRFAPQTGGNLSDYLQGQSFGIEPASTMLSGTGITPPSLYTLPADEIGPFTAVLTGSVVHDGWDLITACGFCYATHPDPNLEDMVELVPVPEGDFSASLLNLNPDTGYYFRSFATNAAGTAFGEELSFHTLPGTLDSPQNLRISIAEGVAILIWDAVTGAVSYKIYRSSDPYAPDWGLPFTTTPDTHFNDPSTGTRYFYRVTAASE